MADFPVSGKPIPEIDLRHITVSEWRDLFDRTKPEHEGDKVVAKMTGMTDKEVKQLPLYDYRALIKAILEKSGQPLENDPKE
jgi:hypothetical protein